MGLTSTICPWGGLTISDVPSLSLTISDVPSLRPPHGETVEVRPIHSSQMLLSSMREIQKSVSESCAATFIFQDLTKMSKSHIFIDISAQEVARDIEGGLKRSAQKFSTIVENVF